MKFDVKTERDMAMRADLCDSRAMLAACDAIEALEKVVEAARSVASEPAVADLLTCYNMGVELLDRLAKLDGGKATQPPNDEDLVGMALAAYRRST